MKKASMLLGLALFWIQLTVSAALIAERPLPVNNAYGVGASPALVWSINGPNILTNGGFEQGTAGWTIFNGGMLHEALSRTSPTEGTNSLKMDIGQASTSLALPADAAGIVWSFQIVDNFQGMEASVRTAGQSGRLETFKLQGRHQNATNTYSVDISEFAGQTVTLGFRFFGDIAAYHYLDDVRVTVIPPGTQFEIYFGPNELTSLGRTNRASWPLKDLRANAAYRWRADAISNGVTNKSPEWHFSTGYGTATVAMGVTELPAVVCADSTTPFEVFNIDDLGFQTAASGTLTLTAAADNARPPSVVISEVDTGANDRVEFINTSANPISVKGWKVQLFGGLTPNPSSTTTLPDASLAPGQIFTMSEIGADYAWPSLYMPGINWGDSGNIAAAVVLRDATNGVIDCIFIGNPQAINSVAPVDWLGPLITNTAAAGFTYQRIGNRDSNTREDWTIAASTFGLRNSALELPFTRGFGKITNAIFKPLIGHPNRSLQVPQAAANARIIAKTTSSGLLAVSDPFQVSPPGTCLSLFAPATIRENAGAETIRVVLPSPAQADLAVSLVSSHPAIAQAPPSITIPSGSSEAIAQLAIINNELLEGTRTIAITATIPGYNLATAAIRILDDETAALAIEAPPEIHEGSLSEIFIKMSSPPVTNIQLRLTTDYSGLSTYLFRFPAGAVQTSFSIPDDGFVQGSGPVHFRIEYEDWPSGEAVSQFFDNENNSITVSLPEPLVEGNRMPGVIQLNGSVLDDTTITLSSSQPDILEVPANVVISRTGSSASFYCTALENSRPMGEETVTITASSPGFVNGVAEVKVKLYPTPPPLSVQLSSDGMNLRLQFTGIPGWWYRLQSTLSLAEQWSMSDIIPLVNNQAELTFPTYGTSTFYKIYQTPAD